MGTCCCKCCTKNASDTVNMYQECKARVSYLLKSREIDPHNIGVHKQERQMAYKRSLGIGKMDVYDKFLVKTRRFSFTPLKTDSTYMHQSLDKRSMIKALSDR